MTRPPDRRDRPIDLLVIGEINPDIIVRGADVTPTFGQVDKLVERIHVCPGSSSVITALGAARLGLRTTFVGVVGNDHFGEYMLSAMAARDVDTSSCLIDRALPTGATVILDNGGDRGTLTSMGTIGALRTDQVPRRLLNRCRHVHVGSYFLLSAARPGLPALFAEARDAGMTTSFDCNWDPDNRWEGINGMLPATDIFFLNGQEARRITGFEDDERAAEALADAGRVVALKLGARGALAIAGDRVARANALRVAVVDAIGAGDSFDAGFLYAWLSSWNLNRSLELAVACGSLSTRGAGGTVAQPELSEALEYCAR